MAEVSPSLTGSVASRLHPVFLAFKRAQCGQFVSAGWHLKYHPRCVLRGPKLPFYLELQEVNLIHERQNNIRCASAS